MKMNWANLLRDRCPVVGCKVGGRKTQLVVVGTTSQCPECGGEWSMEIPAPMDLTWIEVKKPHNKSLNIRPPKAAS